MDYHTSIMKTIKYPSGKYVQKNDIVWTNEGLNIRKVLYVVSNGGDRLLGVQENGFFWTRYISPRDLGIIGYENFSQFSDEGVDVLSEASLRYIRLLFYLLGKQLNLSIWDNPDYLYYPVLFPHYDDNMNVQRKWYLFFQPYEENIKSFDTEQCYSFNRKIRYFEKINDDNIQNLVRGL